jgi:adenylate cyclase
MRFGGSVERPGLARTLAGHSKPDRSIAILAADVAGYSRLMGADEEGTLAR